PRKQSAAFSRDAATRCRFIGRAVNKTQKFPEILTWPCQATQSGPSSRYVPEACGAMVVLSPEAFGETALALNRARQKNYWRLLPLLFTCYVIAYVDRANVGIAKLTMTRDLAGFDNAVIGFGAGLFFIGYFLLEIPGTLIVEKWSARKWICRIMITWG